VRNWVVLHGLQMKLHFCGFLSDEPAEAKKCQFLLMMARMFYQRKMYIEQHSNKETLETKTKRVINILICCFL